MNSQLQKQILIGALAGVLVSVLAFFLLGGKRDEIKALDVAIGKLQQEVATGNSLKQNAEKLRLEIAQQEKRIDELIKIMPNEQDRGELPYRMKKLADTAGIEQQSFTNENPLPKQYYTEYPVKFEFRTGYHNFGQFSSLISGYEKIINLSEIVMLRDASAKAGIFPAKVTCKVSAFIYNASGTPEAVPGKKGAPAAAKAAAKPAKKDKGEGE